MEGQGRSWAVTAEHQTAAQELHRRRLAAGQGIAPDYRTAVAEVVFLSSYGRTPNMSDLKVNRKSLQFITHDDDGNTVRVIQQQRWPMRVYASRLDVDSYVFATTTPKQTVQFAGWLPMELVEEAPVWWQIENGERTDYAHEIARDLLFAMPSDFKFTDQCPHTDYGAIWSYTFDAWECCGCGRHLYSRQDAFTIVTQDDRFRGERSEDAANATRVER